MSEKFVPTTPIPEIDASLVKTRPTKAFDYRVLAERKEPFTEKLAVKLLELDTFIGERPLRESHVQFLLQEAKRGRFLNNITNLASCVCLWDGKERRLNGQHTCWMKTFMDDKQWAPPVTVLRFEAKTEDDFRALYASFDRGTPRSNANVVDSRLLGTTEFAHVSKRNLSSLASGLRIWLSPPTVRSLSVDEIIDQMQTKHYKLVMQVAQFLETITPQSAAHLYRRAPVVGAMFATFDKAAADSVTFWTVVRDGGADQDHPAACLMKWLLRCAINSTDSTASGLKVGREEMYKCCVNAWNVYRRGDKLKIIRTPDHRVGAK